MGAVAIVTDSSCDLPAALVEELGITIVHQGVLNKFDGYERILADTHFTDADVAYMGDDIVDLSVLGRAGLSACPADAVAEVQAKVDWISRFPGGSGAVRELIELVLSAQNRWDGVVATYTTEGQRA